MAHGRVRSIFPCNQGKSESICKKQFLKEHPQFEFVDVEGDGNCMFRAIAEFYRRSGRTVPGIAHPENYIELRRYAVEQFIRFIMDNIDIQMGLIDIDYQFRLQRHEQHKEHLQNTMIFLKKSKKSIQQALAALPPIVERTAEQILDELREVGSWDNAAFDMMVERVPAILNVNLSIYIINPPTSQNKNYVVSNYMHTPNDGPEAFTTIHLILADNHYGLLYPKNQENANLNAAIAASMHNAERVAHNQQQINNNNARFAEQLQQLQINNKPRSTRKKPSVGVLPIVANNVANNVAPNSYHSNSSIVSNTSLASSIGSFNGFSIENAQEEYPYKTTTVKQLKELLDTYGIKYGSKDTKETLYGLFLMAFMENINKRTRVKLQSNKHSAKQASKVASRKAARNARRAAQHASRKNK